MTLRLRVAVAGGLLLAAAVGLLAVQARQADAALHRAQDRLPTLRDALLDGHDARAAEVLRDVRRDADQAADATDGPLWGLASHVPVLGRSVREVRVVTGSVDALADEVLPPLLDGAVALRPALRGPGLRLDPGALGRAGQQFDTALARLEPIVRTLDRRPDGLLLPAVGAARDDLAVATRSLVQSVRGLAAAGSAGPALLGNDGPRRYFVAFQNNAESRGTGGLLGAYAVVVAHRGRLTVERLGSDVDLYALPRSSTDLGSDYRALYWPDGRLFQNTNLSAHFPYAAQQWVELWRRHTGQRLDGAIATDPVALSHLLGATGPVRLPDGSELRSDNVVAETEQVAYLRFAADDSARKRYLVGVARVVLDRLLGARPVPRTEVLRALVRSATERRLVLWSAHPAEQARLAGTALAGEVVDQPGPFAFLVVNNGAGNKIDYYLRRALRYELDRCHHGRRLSTVTAVLRNDVPASPQPRFVSGRHDAAAATATPGSTSLLVSLLVARGAVLRSVTLDGEPVRVFAGLERGHPDFALTVELPRATPRTLVLQLVEPAVRAAPVVPVQPLASDQRTVVHDSGC